MQFLIQWDRTWCSFWLEEGDWKFVVVEIIQLGIPCTTLHVDRNMSAFLVCVSIKSHFWSAWRLCNCFVSVSYHSGLFCGHSTVPILQRERVEEAERPTTCALVEQWVVVFQQTSQSLLWTVVLVGFHFVCCCHRKSLDVRGSFIQQHLFASCCWYGWKEDVQKPTKKTYLSKIPKNYF